jgi:hypothetical protein
VCRLFAASRGKRSLSSDAVTHRRHIWRYFPRLVSCSREVQDGDNPGETAFVLLDQLRRDSARSRPEPLAAAARKVICGRVPLANWPENPFPLVNSGLVIYDRHIADKLGPRGFGLSRTS